MFFYNGIQKVIYSKLITTISGGQLKRIGRILIPIPFVSIIVLLSSKIFPVVYLFPYFDGTLIAPHNGKRICPPCKCPFFNKNHSCYTLNIFDVIEAIVSKAFIHQELSFAQLLF